MGVDLEVEILALVELLDTIPCVVGILCLCVRHILQRNQVRMLELKIDKLLIGVCVFLRAQIVLQENVYKHSLYLISVFKKRTHSTNN